MHFANTVTIRRSREDVFAYLSEFENLPAWNYALSSTRRTDAGPVGVGAQYTQTREIPRHAVETFEVIQFEPVERLAIRGPSDHSAQRAAITLRTPTARRC